MRFRVCLLAVCTVALLSGCSLSTPSGTVHITYDTEEVSQETKLTVGDKEIVLDSGSMKESLDSMLDSVSVPEGTTTEDLKKFVYDKLELAGIDLDSEDSEDVDSSKLSETLDEALDEYGVDLSEKTSLIDTVKSLVSAAKDAVKSADVSGTMNAAKESLESNGMDSSIVDGSVFTDLVGE